MIQSGKSFRYIAVMLFCISITAYTLSRFALLIQPLLSIKYDWKFELGMVVGQLVFQFPFLYKRPVAVYLQYYYNMLLVSLMGSILLFPLILINHWYVCDYWIDLSYFFVIVGVMFIEHKRRVKKTKTTCISELYMGFIPTITIILYCLMEKKIVIAGGTGFIGKYLATCFTQQGYQVKVIARQTNSIQWDDKACIIDALEGAEMLINLAGKSVDCRYNEKNKREILASRTETTRMLGDTLLLCKNPPELWINSSTATIYRHAEDRPMTEANGEIGTGFSVGIATKWEKAFFDFELPATRQVALRMAIVIGDSGGVMRPLKNLVRLGLGGKQGSGRQRFSWIHIEDLKNIILFIQSHKEMSGVFNCASPNPVTNQILMHTLRKSMGMPFGLPSPEWLLEIGAVLINTETELVLKSRWVIPERLIESGFQFQYPEIGKAISRGV